MSPSWIRARTVKVTKRNPRGRTFQVLYRRGGRDCPIETAGTFKTEKLARDRRDLVAGWLARGLNPKAELALLAGAVEPERKTRERWLDDWLASRHDIAGKSERAYRAGVNAIYKILPDGPLEDITVTGCLDAVGELATKYKPATTANYWTAFVMLLDYIGVDPNPARDRRVKLPRLKRATLKPPSREHVEAMLNRLGRKYLLPFATLEQTAARVETIEALTWDNVDVAGNRLRLFEKGGKVRFVPMPDWLMQHLAATCAPEDRSAGRRVFPTVTATGLRTAMANACKAAEIPHYHPHDLRHRRASLWHLQAIPDAVLAERLGHEKASFSKDVYAHVMPDDEVQQATWEAILVMTP